MDKHTEGPWYIVGDDEADGVPVIEIAHGEIPSSQYKQICYVQPTDTEECEFVLAEEDRANAHLIASAPELLSALQKIVLDWDGEPEDMYAARKAIAKAEGREW